MRAAVNSGRCWIDWPATVKEDDVAIWIVADTMNKTVSTISLMASGLASSAAAAHLHELGQRLAGITLDAPQFWPTHEG